MYQIIRNLAGFTQKPVSRTVYNEKAGWYWKSEEVVLHSNLESTKNAAKLLADSWRDSAKGNFLVKECATGKIVAQENL